MRHNPNAKIDVLTVTIVAPTFLLGHMFGLSIFPMLNDALVEGSLAAVLLLAGVTLPTLYSLSFPPAAVLTLRKAIDAYRNRHLPPPPPVVTGEMYGRSDPPKHNPPSLVAVSVLTNALSLVTIIALGSNTRPGLLPRCRSHCNVLLSQTF